MSQVGSFCRFVELHNEQEIDGIAIDEDDNDDVCFDTEDRREKKAYEVDYVAHSTTHLRRIQNVQIDQVVNILGKCIVRDSSHDA